ncbi:MAG: AAA family ATPase [Lactobacillales bacterium]|jgi:hypothetical protein|nr:AAA family ATPase [Lactobacillales bacterium]
MKFNVTPRFVEKFDLRPIRLDQPPRLVESEKFDKLNLIPNILMGLSFAMYSFTTNILFSLVMLGSTIATPLLFDFIGKKNTLRKNRILREKYIEYLNRKINDLKVRKNSEKNIYLNRYPSLEVLKRRVLEMNRKLFEKKPGHEDYLKLEIGRGTVAAKVQFDVTEGADFVCENSDLLLKYQELIGSPVVLEDAPIVVGRSFAVLGSSGLFEALMIQVIANYSPENVRVALYGMDVEMVKDFPHLYDGDFRMVAFNSEQIKKLDKILLSRDLAIDYIIFANLKSDFIEKVLIENPDNIRVIYFAEKMSDINHNINLIADFRDNPILFDLLENTQKSFQRLPDEKLDEELAEKLANLEEEKMLEKIEGLATHQLEVPIAPGFMLDLHENAFGPHALIAGTTGSGKSEFLANYLLMLANYYPPEIAQFVIVDYKGGELSSRFEGVRNLVGAMTDLKKQDVERVRFALEKEIEKRERERNYLPHLFVVVDEFAQMAAKTPEFLDALVSMARVGRSLGIHLILSTQKPGAIVSDQILSNAKTKICFKVNDASESREMVNTDKCIRFKRPGEFMMLVGYDDYLFENRALDLNVPVDDKALDILGVQGEVVRTITRDSMTHKEKLFGQVQGAPPRELWCKKLPKNPKINSVALIDDIKNVRQYEDDFERYKFIGILGEGEMFINRYLEGKRAVKLDRTSDEEDIARAFDLEDDVIIVIDKIYDLELKTNKKIIYIMDKIIYSLINLCDLKLIFDDTDQNKILDFCGARYTGELPVMYDGEFKDLSVSEGLLARFERTRKASDFDYPVDINTLEKITEKIEIKKANEINYDSDLNKIGISGEDYDEQFFIRNNQPTYGYKKSELIYQKNRIIYKGRNKK